MRLRQFLLVLGVLGTGWLWLQAPDESLPAAVAQPRPRPAVHDPLPALATLTPRTQLVDRQAARRDDRLFGALDPTPSTPEPVAIDLPQPAVAAPSAPALPFSYLGKKLEGGQWEVFLVKGEQTLVVRQGSVVDAQYRVDAIAPPELQLTYLPLGERQTLTIGDAP